MRALLLALSPFALHASGVTVTKSVLQGETVRIEASGLDAVAARMNGKPVPLFRQPDGVMLGLMPVKVLGEPGEYDLELLSKDGEVVHSEPVTVGDADFPVQNIVATKQMKSLTTTPDERAAIAALKKAVTPRRYWQDHFRKPTPQCQNSPFGVQRYHNGKPSGNFHGGLDLRSPAGTPIHAAADGVVKISKVFRLHGGTIGIDHGQGLTTLYIHMSKLAVAEGRRVRQGDIIGNVGSTGFATGPHLHWAVYVHGEPVNPAQWLEKTPVRCGQ